MRMIRLPLVFLWTSFYTTFRRIINHFRSVDNYMLKSDEESIEILLKTDVDKAKFQTEIDKLVNEDSKSREVFINNRKITISI